MPTVDRRDAPPQAHGPTRSDTGEDRYVKAALEGGLGRLTLAPFGTRNDALNRASFSVGTLAGRIDLTAAAYELHRVALMVGLADAEITGRSDPASPKVRNT